MTDSEITLFADAPVYSETLEEAIFGTPTSPFQDESHSGDIDINESHLPLHLLSDSCKSLALCQDFKFSYNPSDLRELEEDDNGGVHESDDEADQINLSCGLLLCFLPALF
jgi:hypothetical protein